ncbi:hydroxymethylbilane synthase [Nibricoccus sp. IMCC34717]|uniref:hydroxymethylbilane synthase n=1 Tax=Nibricoccus sp. IMCC34717 TaxID=3034021 RepID=UPI0038516CE4
MRLATRKSPLALAQTEMVAAHLRERLAVETELVRLVTTGDRQTEWSLERQGGKGLFTKELEEALLRGDADVAVHSTKDLPGDMPAGLAIAGYLPREDARDVLVVRDGVDEPRRIATSSPRRRLQLAMLFPNAEFCEIRGNVDTRLKKIASGDVADATMLAAAGLKRLGIGSWPGVSFHALGFEHMVPAVGQAAVAIQCREGDVARFAGIFDSVTHARVTVERAFQRLLGGGCQTAFAAHVASDTLYFFHHEIGLRSLPLSEADLAQPETFARTTLQHFGFKL